MKQSSFLNFIEYTSLIVGVWICMALQDYFKIYEFWMFLGDHVDVVEWPEHC